MRTLPFAGESVDVVLSSLAVHNIGQAIDEIDRTGAQAWWPTRAGGLSRNRAVRNSPASAGHARSGSLLCWLALLVQAIPGQRPG